MLAGSESGSESESSVGRVRGTRGVTDSYVDGMVSPCSSDRDPRDPHDRIAPGLTVSVATDQVTLKLKYYGTIANQSSVI